MSTPPLFCGIDLARRIEAAEADLIVAATEAAAVRGARGLVLPLAGGYAVSAEDGSPMNKVVGLGFDGVPDDKALTDVEAAFAAFGAPVQVELSNLADPDVGAALTARGYRLVGFEDVLGRDLTAPTPAPASGITVRKADADELDAWVDAIVDGFAHPDGEGVLSHEEFPHDVLERAERDFEAAGAVAYIAECSGAVVGAGSVRFTSGVAQLTGAATRPSHRRRGVQAAMLATRLADAAATGCDLAVVTTAPGSTSQKNVQRSGFHLLYTRAVLVREPR
ncbi:GNAT family N-acetyltransferase [Mycolicibacterium confluentis]|uniref:GNAT family acetyltransferase n=1 Tax=Mycolicibacterium confluentis TaxID=28047 RepID=A0A7I7XSR2_9MYCO|nr:GNAT family N-acetyltransferase [Mycolicibacterium confluentis]MCV7321403.1 GNAT family N-acetyltransferase [Mycolicibacterium confluentis]ORV33055.1 GNAT family acetyltransferase [Mycolicibacterium confluentis]BBZ32113.1 GNAT family acetyltransferase [Mycolicibacterium confluentis]